MNNASRLASLLALTNTGLLLAAFPAAAQETVTIEFSQAGFPSGGTVTGTLTGTDLDGDGQIYAVSRVISDLFGLPFGNEVDFAEVTFTGFNLDAPVTIVYDKSVADMEAPENTFLAFAYNNDGGSWGDDPEEGVSFSEFSPSTNWWMGEAFNFIFNPDVIPDVALSPCGSGATCAGVLGLDPDPESPTGVEVVYQDYTSALVQTTVITPVEDRVFQVNVVASFGGSFTDCFRFGPNSDLFVDGLGQTLTYRAKRLDTSPDAWQATSRTGAPLPIAFSGRIVGEAAIVGNGVSEQGDTFVFRGTENAACSLRPQLEGPAWRQ
jgi:hypothetical protein